MTWLAKATMSRATVVILAALAWFTASNHCLLALMTQPRQKAVSMAHCPAHCSQTDDKSSSQSGMLACCQGLLSSNLDTGKQKISSNPFLIATQLFVIGPPVFPKAPERILPSIEYDTGPPLPGFLVETVLRRSLCENAPPRLS